MFFKKKLFNFLSLYVDEILGLSPSVKLLSLQHCGKFKTQCDNPVEDCKISLCNLTLAAS